MAPPGLASLHNPGYLFVQTPQRWRNSNDYNGGDDDENDENDNDDDDDDDDIWNWNFPREVILKNVRFVFNSISATLKRQ